MTVLITLTTAGADSGPFDLYSDLDGYVSAFETGVSKAALLAGYSSALVPDGTNSIRIKSVGVCVNYIDIILTGTTTTTTTAIPVTTTTTTVAPTTTTTTTATPLIVTWGGACGSGIPTRNKFGADDSLSDGCAFSLLISGGSVTLEASSFLSSGTSLETTISVTAVGSSTILNSIPGTTTYGSTITLPPGSYTGTFGYVFTDSQGTATVRVIII